jgi:hypothetical protein
MQSSNDSRNKDLTPCFLLSLSRELRDKILELVLLTENEPPPAQAQDAAYESFTASPISVNPLNPNAQAIVWGAHMNQGHDLSSHSLAGFTFGGRTFYNRKFNPGLDASTRRPHYKMAILRVNRQVYEESRVILLGQKVRTLDVKEFARNMMGCRSTICVAKTMDNLCESRNLRCKFLFCSSEAHFPGFKYEYALLATVMYAFSKHPASYPLNKMTIELTLRIKSYDTINILDYIPDIFEYATMPRFKIMVRLAPRLEDMQPGCFGAYNHLVATLDKLRDKFEKAGAEVDIVAERSFSGYTKLRRN